MLAMKQPSNRPNGFDKSANARVHTNGFLASSSSLSNTNGSTSTTTTTTTMTGKRASRAETRRLLPVSSIVRAKKAWFAILIVDTENDTRPILHKTQYPIHFVSLCNELHEKQRSKPTTNTIGQVTTTSKSRAGFIEDIVRSTLQNSQKSKQAGRKKRVPISDIEMLRARLEQLETPSIADNEDTGDSDGDDALADDDAVPPPLSGTSANDELPQSNVVDDEEDLSAFFSFHIDACEHCCTTCMSDAINRSMSGDRCAEAKDVSHHLFYFRNSSTPVNSMIERSDDDDDDDDDSPVPAPRIDDDDVLVVVEKEITVPEAKRVRRTDAATERIGNDDDNDELVAACPRCASRSASSTADADTMASNDDSPVWNVGRYRIGQINGPFYQERDAEKYIKVWSSGKRGTISKAARGEVLATHFQCETYGDLRVIFLNDDAGNYIACSCKC